MSKNFVVVNTREFFKRFPLPDGYEHPDTKLRYSEDKALLKFFILAVNPALPPIGFKLDTQKWHNLNTGEEICSVSTAETTLQ